MTDLQAILDKGGPWEQARIIGGQLLIQGDCLEVMAVLPKVDAVVTDPPYGIGEKWDKQGRFGSCGGRLWTGGAGWDAKTNPDALDGALNVAGGRGIVWGGNYYDLPPSRGYLVWDKMQTGFSLADSELAWCSDPITPKTFRYARAQLASEGKIHPTQKPLSLMEWCLGFLPDARTILDPFAGSGTTAVACQRLGRQSISIELDADYWAIMCKRVQEVVDRPPLFTPAPPKPTQGAMDL